MLVSLATALLALPQGAPRQEPTWVPDAHSRWVQTWLSPTSQTVAADGLRTADTAELAARLLPPSVAGVVDRHQIGDGGTGEPPAVVVFHTPVAPVDADACRRANYSVALRSAGDGSTLRGVSVTSSLELALAPMCHGEPGWRMAQVSARHPAEALETLRWLRDARALAAGEADLPFDVHCVSSRTEACASGARAALARLPLHQTFAVSSFQNQWHVIVTPGRPDDLHWRIRIDRPVGGRASITMDWTWPPPF